MSYPTHAEVAEMIAAADRDRDERHDPEGFHGRIADVLDGPATIGVDGTRGRDRTQGLLSRMAAVEQRLGHIESKLDHLLDGAISIRLGAVQLTKLTAVGALIGGIIAGIWRILGG